MRFLLLGGTGQVGQEFHALELPSGVEVVAPDRSVLDLRNEQAIADIIAAEKWDAVINASGYTDVDRAESEQAAAFAINAVAPSRLAVETERYGIPLIHISTDYVFDGRKGSPYVEEDSVGPINVYGRSKLAGEHAVGAGNPRHVILRTSWVYSPYRRNFVKTILRLAAERDHLTIVDDQHGCPTAASDVAKMCCDIALRCSSAPERVRYGVYHFTGKGEASWFEFAKVIIELASSRLDRLPKVIPIRTIDYPTPAVRPIDSRLDCAAVIRQFDVRLRPWRAALEETIKQLLDSDGVA